MRVVHIGSQKTATTSLQDWVFPKLRDLGLAETYNDPTIMHAVYALSKSAHWDPKLEALRCWALERSNFLISHEGLMGAAPTCWIHARDMVHRAFGSDTTILITIREPVSLMRSQYQQQVADGLVKAPEEYFVSQEYYGQIAMLNPPAAPFYFNVDEFDLEQLVSLYRARFQRVVVAALDRLDQLAFVREIWNAADSEIAVLRKHFAASPRKNSAYSQIAMDLTLGRERLLNGFGLQSRSSFWGLVRRQTMMVDPSTQGDCLAAAPALAASESRMARWPGVWRLRKLCRRLEKAGRGLTRRIPLLSGRWWARLGRKAGRALVWKRMMKRLIPRLPGGGKPYALPDSIYLGEPLDRNRRFYTDLVGHAGGCAVYDQRADGPPDS